MNVCAGSVYMNVSRIVYCKGIYREWTYECI